MFDKNMNYIDELNRVEIYIYEVMGAIYTRENNKMLRLLVEKFEQIIDDIFIENGFSIENYKKEKNKLLINFEKVIGKYLATIEKMYISIFKVMQDAEINQNLIFVKRSTLEHVEDLIDSTQNDDEKQRMMLVAKQLSVSVNNLDDKIRKMEIEFENYNKVVDFCSKHFKICKEKREEAVNNMLNKNFTSFFSDIKVNIYKSNLDEEKEKIVNIFNDFINGIKDKEIPELDKKIGECTKKFLSEADKLKNNF